MANNRFESIFFSVNLRVKKITAIHREFFLGFKEIKVGPN